MLDHQLKPLLIEANSNPCLETSGVILGKLIPELVDNVLMTAVDPLFPPPKYLPYHPVRPRPRNT
jgi:tubulin polyglutamylase TTLL1